MTTRDKLNTIGDPTHLKPEEDEEIVHKYPAIIFDTSDAGEKVPAEFDAVRVLIDGKIKADLSWKKEQEAAREYAKQGLRILWEIDLGLPGSLQQALSNRTQFLSLCLSIEHFLDTLWKEFRDETIGLCLYRGSADFSINYPWDEEQNTNLQGWLKDLFGVVESLNEEIQLDISDFTEATSANMKQTLHGSHLLSFFCRDAIGEYITLLASRVPDNLPLFILFDVDRISDPLIAALMITKERYPRFHIALKNTASRENQVLGGEIAWEGNTIRMGGISQTLERAKLGFCLPKMTLCRPSSLNKLREAFTLLKNSGLAFRVIPEVDLAAEWDGLDDLIVDTQSVELQFKRKLQGFCAAGGTVVALGEVIGFAQEIPFDEFL